MSIHVKQAADGNLTVENVSSHNVEKSCNCCCAGHCNLSRDYHSNAGNVVGVSLAKLDLKLEKKELEFPNVYEGDLLDQSEMDYFLANDPTLENDPLMKMLTAMETNFSLDS